MPGPDPTHDPTFYLGCAAHYLVGRPPYAADLAPEIARELALDGHGTLVDVGCGPGVLAVELAGLVTEVIGIDPDPDMLREAEAHASARGVTNAQWQLDTADALAAFAPESLRLVSFGQSYHWTDRETTAEVVFDRLEPGCSMIVVSHDHETPPVPDGPGDPMIPHDEIKAIIRSYLGDARRAGQGVVEMWPDRYEDAIGRTRFGPPRSFDLPGRTDITRDIDGVISGFLSMSFAAPHLFGDRLDAFVADVRALLEPMTPTGRFWDWPGDTSVIVATKPR